MLFYLFEKKYSTENYRTYIRYMTNWFILIL